MSLKLYPLGTQTKLYPFLGGGTGFYFWSAGIDGAWVDFKDEYTYYDENLSMDIPIYPADFYKTVSESKVTIGYHMFAGFMIHLTKRTTVDAQFKYNIAKGKFSSFFEGYEPFDIS